MRIANTRKRELLPCFGICVAIAAACLLCAPQARAITFSGNTSGVFINPTGPSGMVKTGVGTNFFTWGTGVNSAPSWLYFGGTNFSGVQTDQTFWLGGLSYFNGKVLLGTEAYSVDLRTKITFTSPIGLTKYIDYDFQLINTVNGGAPGQTPDTVYLSTIFPSTAFSVGGIDYTLKLGFASLVGGVWTPVNNFNILEGSTTSASLIGVITALTPRSVPDTGSTLALMALAVVGLGGLRHYMGCRA